MAVNVKTRNPEYESGTFLQNAGKHLLIHTVQKSRRPASSTQKRACNYRGADKSLACFLPGPDQEGNKLTFLSEWREFPSAPYLAREKKS